MPSGKAHDIITAIGAAAAVPVWWYLTVEPRHWEICGTLVGATLFSGWLLSPDLDLNSSIYKRWGPLRFLWYPYQKLVPHRSWFSHSWLLSPLMRVAYLLGMVWLVAWAVLWGLRQSSGLGPGTPERTPWDLCQDIYRSNPQATLMAIVGLIFGTALHTGADTIYSFVKRRRR